jgi:hypothetical protein
MNVWVYAQYAESFGDNGDEYESRDAAIAAAILDSEISGSYVTGKLEESYPIDYDALCDEIFSDAAINEDEIDHNEDAVDYIDAARLKHKPRYDDLISGLKASVDEFIKGLASNGLKMDHTIVVEIEAHEKP